MQHALLIGVEIKGERSLFSVNDSLDELELLANTAGVTVKGCVIQRLNRVDPATFIGSGKLEDIVEQVAELDINLVIFDDELSPRHQREIEKVFDESDEVVQVIDRSALILDIFAQHAHTREGALQVELAQYEYRLPRLTRQWSHLARQAGGGTARGGAGGVGLRGPGETQLEVDRREIRRRISKLKSELEAVRAHRQRHRSQRVRAGMSTVALVGYTNAGKSTLLRALSGADIYIADQLFATLDPTTRRITLPGGQTMLMSDTVGFIQKLPVTLVAAFRATLEEVAEANLLLHVVDASHPLAWNHIDVVEDTLAEIEATRVPKILVLNKVDLGRADSVAQDYESLGYRAVVQTSALRSEGLDELLAVVEQTLGSNLVDVSVLIPYSQGDLLSAIHEHGTVLDETHLEHGVRVAARVPPRLAGRLQQLLGDSELGREEEN